MSRFQDVCDNMQKRKISVIELREIKDHYEQMKRLCEAATTHNESGQLSYTGIDSVLSQIMEEFNVFEDHRSHLSHLCSNIPVAVQGKLAIMI